MSVIIAKAERLVPVILTQVEKTDEKQRECQLNLDEYSEAVLRTALKILKERHQLTGSYSGGYWGLDDGPNGTLEQVYSPRAIRISNPKFIQWVRKEEEKAKQRPIQIATELFSKIVTAINNSEEREVVYDIDVPDSMKVFSELRGLLEEKYPKTQINYEHPYHDHSRDESTPARLKMVNPYFPT